jgi:predicted deacylase
LYAECPGKAWLQPAIVETYVSGVLEIMRHLGMIDGSAPLVPTVYALVGDGDVDHSLTAPAGGYVVSRANLLDDVHRGVLLGSPEDPAGETIAELRAPSDAVLFLRRETPRVSAGEIAYLLTQRV